MKVDVEKLICFLMSDEVIENNIPESLKLGLEQQGLKCEDGKIHSLKQTATWKPSDEQMDALRYVANFDYGGHKATLVSLYEQLKKLREK